MKLLVKTVLVASAFCFSTIAAAQMPSINKHAQKNVSCAACHVNGKFEPVPASQCQTCHNPEQLAKKTEKLNFESRIKNPKTGEIKSHTALINPHDSYHFGKTEDCNDCHRNHKESVNDCATCHDTKAWGMKDPA